MFVFMLPISVRSAGGSSLFKGTPWHPDYIINKKKKKKKKKSEKNKIHKFENPQKII